MRYGEDDLIKKLSSKSGKAVRATAIKPGPKLCMFLDEDRDGVVEEEPAKCVRWEWGDCKKGDHKGAIVLVKNQLYQSDENVDERLPIKIDWDDQKKELSKEWAATLQIVENPDQIRIYDNSNEGAKQVLGKGIKGNLFAIHQDNVLPVHLNKGQAVILWMEAVDYPQKTDGSDACVTLQLKFTDLRFKGLAQTTIVQEAQVRIAPWIMASDLDETKVVFARAPKDDKCVAKQIEKFAQKAGCVFQPIKAKETDKVFMRDVIKAGYVTVPGRVDTRVVLERLDHKAKLRYYVEDQQSKVRKLLLENAPGIENVALATVPKTLDKWPEKWRESQDNGGNYLVSPSTEEHPWGRIIFGEGIIYVKYVCNLGDFLCAQRLQEPIILDPTWLRVGHVDEIIAFIPKPYKILISNSRLAYSLLYGIAWALSQPNKGFSSDYYMKLVNANARAIEIKICKVKDKDKYGEGYIELLEKYFCKFSELKNKIADGDNLSGDFGEYKPDDPPARSYSGRMIIPQKGGLKFNAKDIADFLEKPKVNIAETQIFKNSMAYQQFIDEGSREILKKELQKEDSDFIDLPVLFESGVGGAEGITGDSTNMLIIVKNEKCHCLIAKPFGPVLDQKYVFQEYIKERLISDAKIKEANIDFANNWADMHLENGEIHCGTNQLPARLLEDKRKWWIEEPPKIVVRALSEKSKREITHEPKLKVKFIGPPAGCFIDPSEAEIEITKTVANADLEYNVTSLNLKAGDIIKVEKINSKLGAVGRSDEFKISLAPETEIAVVKATSPKLYISFVGEPADGCEVREILSELNLENAIKDHAVQHSINGLALGSQIKVSDIWARLCPGGQNPAFTIREGEDTVVAEIIEGQEQSEAPPPPPLME